MAGHDRSIKVTYTHKAEDCRDKYRNIPQWLPHIKNIEVTSAHKTKRTHTGARRRACPIVTRTQGSSINADGERTLLSPGVQGPVCQRSPPQHYHYRVHGSAACNTQCPRARATTTRDSPSIIEESRSTSCYTRIAVYLDSHSQHLLCGVPGKIPHAAHDHDFYLIVSVAVTTPCFQ